MSKRSFPVLAAVSLGFTLLILSKASAAQALEASITLDSAGRSAHVTGKFRDGKEVRKLSFLRRAIGVSDLGGRISAVQAFRGEREVKLSRPQNSEIAGESTFSGFAYRVDLSPPPDPRSAAHASWLGDDSAVLFLDDLLPLAATDAGKSAAVVLTVPAGWKVWSDQRQGGFGTYQVPDMSRAVFVLGKGLARTASEGGVEIVQSTGFLFSPEDTSVMTAEVFRYYSKMFAVERSQNALVTILPFPQKLVPKGVWEAETRGGTVVLISSDMPFRTQSLQRLHEQLRHEMFHIWVPNGVNLKGNYDWFYEGFALYAALKAGMMLNRLRFEDMLDTLSRAYRIEGARSRPLSLIAASNERWSGAETYVYARGMIIAFLCDVELLRRSKGRISLEILLRRFYAAHKPPAPAVDANSALSQLFEREPGLAAVLQDYVSGDKAVDLGPGLEAAGLEFPAEPSGGGLRIRSKLNGAQKAVLDKLGYNNWRKLNRNE